MKEFDNDSISNLLPEQDNKIKNVDENEYLKKSKNENEEKMKEKKHLHSILINIANKLDEEDDNDDEKDNQYPIKIDQITKIKTRIQSHWVQNTDDKCYSCGLWILFSFLLPFLTSINLIGIFQIISVMNAFSKALKSAIWCYFDWEDKEDKSSYDFYNFYSFYFKESKNEEIDFDLIETMSFLGMILYEFYGFSISSVLFMIPNGLSLFLIYMFFSGYDDASEKYTFLQILYLCICYVLLFIGVGSSALLSQQILTDNLKNYMLFLKQISNKENNEENENNYFIFIFGTLIVGTLVKYISDIIISYKKYSFDLKYNITDLYDYNNKITNNNSTDNEINNIIFDNDQYLFFFFIIGIYGVSIFLSLLLYSCFQNWTYKDDDEAEIEILGTDKGKREFINKTIVDKNKYKPKEGELPKDENKRICKIFGYIFYLEKFENRKDIDIQ